MTDTSELEKSLEDLSVKPAWHKKREFLFQNINAEKIPSIQIDEVASYSVTEAKSADTITRLILQNCPKGIDASSITILDGMACVGGNTMSFAKKFGNVIANELDTGRYAMLQNNVFTVMNLENVIPNQGNVLEQAFSADYEVLFLDPEWGGPDYKQHLKLTLKVGDQMLDQFCKDVIKRAEKCRVIALKLPSNYDNQTIKKLAQETGFSYNFFETNLRNMTLTILRRDGISSNAERPFMRPSERRALREGGAGECGDRVCFAFQKGECTRGSSCRFAHPDGVAGAGDSHRDVWGSFGGRYRRERPGGDSSGGYGGSFGGGSFGRGQGACYAFQRGECDRGDSCRFSHEESTGNGDANRNSRGSDFGWGSSRGSDGGAYSRTKVCFAFQRGECDRGESCRFAHE